MRKIAIALCLILCLLTSACGADYAATAGKWKVSEGEINFYLSSIKSQMNGTELASDEDWQTQEIEGMRAIDFAKERALETAANNVAYVEIAEYLGIELTSEDESSISNVKKSLISQYGGESGYKAFLKAQNIDDSFIDMLCNSMIYSEKLADIAVEQSPITDEEREAAFEKLSADGNYKAKHILILTVDPDTMQPLTEEEQQQAETKADELYQRVLSGEDFDALMNEYSQDPGLAANPDGYVFSTGEMLEEFESCVDSLEINGIGFAQSDFGYHIIKRLSLGRSDLEEKITAQVRSDKLSAAMAEWKEAVGFTITKNDSVFDAIS